MAGWLEWIWNLIVDYLVVFSDDIVAWLDSGSTPEQPTSSAAAAKKRRKKKKPAAAGAPGSSAAAASPANAAAAPGAAPESDSDEEEEEDAGASGLPSLGFGRRVAVGLTTSVDADGGAWEQQSARSKKQPLRLGAGASTLRQRSGAAPGAAGQQQRKKGGSGAHVCERPGCGAEGPGFKKCGRCRQVYYCTPACLASDWERHQVHCST